MALADQLKPQQPRLEFSSRVISSNNITNIVRQRQEGAVAGATLAAIPELLELAFSFMDQIYLRTTIPLVCKLWSIIARPFILRRLYWNPQWFPSTCLDLNDTNSTPASYGADYNNRILSKLGSIQTLQCQFTWKPLAASLGSRAGLYELQDASVRFNLWRMFLGTLEGLAKEDKLQVQELELFEMMDPETKILPLLRCMPSLARLRLENVVTGHIPLGLIFEACPSLECLEIQDTLRSECQPDLIGTLVDDEERPVGMDYLTSGEGRISVLVPARLRLRRLRLRQLRVSADLLQRLLKACPELQELGLVFLTCDTLAYNELWGSQTGDGEMPTASLPTWKRMYQDLAGWCPRLETFEYSTSHAAKDMVKWIPGLTGLGVMENVLASVSNLRTYLDRLTTLRIGEAPRSNLIRGGLGDALHNYLCEAPLLLHLYAPKTKLYLDRFDLKHHFTLSGRYLDSLRDTMDDAESGQTYNHPYPYQKIWACRYLKTLHVIFARQNSDVESDESSRLMFGYLSKVVPNLEELVFERHLLVLSLQGGLCLLQRMHRLRKLVMTMLYAQTWTDQDFEWMARSFPVGIKQKIQTESLLIGFEADEWNYRKRNPWSLDATLAKEKGEGDSGGIVGRYVFDGVDMKHVGLLNDLVDVYKEREAGKWTCWPEMEWLEVIHGAWDVISSRTMDAIVGGCRPDIRVHDHEGYKTRVSSFHRHQSSTGIMLVDSD